MGLRAAMTTYSLIGPTEVSELSPVKLISPLDGTATFIGTGLRSEAGVSITYLAGTINTTEKRAFERICYRMSRGKALCYFSDSTFTIRDFEGVETQKVVYVLVF
jgi:hypothetical protein